MTQAQIDEKFDDCAAQVVNKDVAAKISPPWRCPIGNRSTNSGRYCGRRESPLCPTLCCRLGESGTHIPET
jgi:hypothetical protein